MKLLKLLFKTKPMLGITALIIFGIAVFVVTSEEMMAMTKPVNILMGIFMIILSAVMGAAIQDSLNKQR